MSRLISCLAVSLLAGLMPLANHAVAASSF